MMQASEVIRFWFEEIDKSLWFKKNDQFDSEIRQRFENIFKSLLSGAANDWAQTPEGALAEIIVLDQFPRNMYRGKPESFSGDALALQRAQEAVKRGDDQKLPITYRPFMYMPYMHSESKVHHEKALQLFSQKGLEENYRFEVLHKNIIDRFGRYPHRNEVLGRKSTAEEIEFLKQPGSGF